MNTHRRFWVGSLERYFATHDGVRVLVWKDLVQTRRGFDIRSLISWLILFGAEIGLLIALDWGTRIWVFIVWVLLIGQVCSKRLSSDLKMWVVFHQLPFSGKETLLAEIASSVTGTILLGYLAFGICSVLNLHPSLPVAILTPGIILCTAFSAIFDILRQSKTEAMSAGHASEMGAVGLMIGLLLAGIPLSLVLAITDRMSRDILLWFMLLPGLLLSLGIAYGMWQLAVSQFRKIE
jgi:hypothetical protein